LVSTLTQSSPSQAASSWYEAAVNLPLVPIDSAKQGLIKTENGARIFNSAGLHMAHQSWSHIEKQQSGTNEAWSLTMVLHDSKLIDHGGIQIDPSIETIEMNVNATSLRITTTSSICTHPPIQDAFNPRSMPIMCLRRVSLPALQWNLFNQFLIHSPLLESIETQTGFTAINHESFDSFVKDVLPFVQAKSLREFKIEKLKTDSKSSQGTSLIPIRALVSLLKTYWSSTLQSFALYMPMRSFDMTKGEGKKSGFEQLIESLLASMSAIQHLKVWIKFARASSNGIKIKLPSNITTSPHLRSLDIVGLRLDMNAAKAMVQHAKQLTTLRIHSKCMARYREKFSAQFAKIKQRNPNFVCRVYFDTTLKRTYGVRRKQHPLNSPKLEPSWASALAPWLKQEQKVLAACEDQKPLVPMFPCWQPGIDPRAHESGPHEPMGQSQPVYKYHDPLKSMQSSRAPLGPTNAAAAATSMSPPCTKGTAVTEPKITFYTPPAQRFKDEPT